MKLIPSSLKLEIDGRISRIQRHMVSADLQVMLVASNVNLYYTTGRFFRGYVYIPAIGEVIWFIIKPESYETEENVIYIRKPEDMPQVLEQKGYPLPSQIGLEFKSLVYSDFLRLSKIFGTTEISDCSSILSTVRMIKTEWEISEMKVDGLRQANVYRKVPECYKPGMTDIELQIEIERELRLEGCLGMARTAGNLMDINLGSVIVGDNADVPGPYDFTMAGAGADPSLPVGASGREIQNGESIMIDMNGSFNGYQTDMTRVWQLGSLTEFAYKCHECSRHILRVLEREALPGVPVSALYDKAMEIVEAEDLKKWFMGHASQVQFIGHGVGIELNEPPVIMKKSRDILSENMTIAIEPKFVIPHIGAVGVENTYVVTKKGLVSLTIFPEEIMNL